MVRRKAPLIALAAACLFAAPVASTRQPTAPGGEILSFKATEATLANGLRVIVVPTGFPDLVSMQIPVQTGSRNEAEPGKTGFAHFFEHLMFRGTPAFPPAKFRAVLTRAGARDNASTGDDFTRYYATFAREDLEPMLQVYADMFQNLSYPEADFRTEARAILGEYNKNSANPLAKLFEVQRDRAFSRHTYKHTTMRFIKDIEDMPNQDELTTGGPNRLSHLQNGRVTTSELDAGDLGLRRATKEDLQGGEPVENAVMLRRLLSGEDASPRSDVVLLNAAAALATADGDLQNGLVEARRSLESGSALAKLDSLITFSQKFR